MERLKVAIVMPTHFDINSSLNNFIKTYQWLIKNKGIEVTLFTDEKNDVMVEGFKVEKITTANLDMIDHYRPRENVVQRPTSLGGKGFIIIERHEKTIPSLHRKIIDNV